MQTYIQTYNFTWPLSCFIHECCQTADKTLTYLIKTCKLVILFFNKCAFQAAVGASIGNVQLQQGGRLLQQFPKCSFSTAWLCFLDLVTKNWSKVDPT